MPLCSMRTSINCSPTRMYGLREVIGSWKIIEICSARSLFNSRSGKFRISRPLKVAEPPIRPFAASRPIRAKAVCDFPEPDSPTIPSVSPARREKFKSFTAVTSPSGVANVTRRSLTFSSALACCCASGAVEVSLRSWLHSLTVFRVEGITQAIANKVKTEQSDHQEACREQQQPW